MTNNDPVSLFNDYFTTTTNEFNAGFITLEEVFARVDAVSVASALVSAIELANNGYLFAPSEAQLATAKAFPAVFTVSTHSAHPFPCRIALA